MLAERTGIGRFEEMPRAGPSLVLTLGRVREVRALHRPVALADWMGDVVDALAGQNKLVFNPSGEDLSVPVVREGGWAVEKYL